ncbi:SsrA-binding protein SmpB [Candidatus Falkowbacteria bacterium]|nr:SsrA-binding protein SmpB [Candidatus Falkowbacteria bacterium]
MPSVILGENKKAHHDYSILQTWEAGLALLGHEVKSVRAQNISLKEAYVTITLNPTSKKPQASLLNCHIGRYPKAGPLPDYDPRRSRRLLLHQQEINSIYGKIGQKGLTVIPLKVYTKGTKIKVALGLGRGKQQFDKRREIKKRDLDREVKRKLKSR